jgi:hypothetical protein
MKNDLFKSIVNEILEEELSKTEKRKAGETWKTDSGKWASINKAHPTYTRYFANEPAARTYATKKIVPSKKSDDAPVSKIPMDSKGKALALKKKPNRFAPKPTANKDTSDDEEASLIKKYYDQNSEPDTDSGSTKKPSHKFGGGGGFSGGGSSGKF